jgi:hypothetical protein
MTCHDLKEKIAISEWQLTRIQEPKWIAAGE